MFFTEGNEENEGLGIEAENQYDALPSDGVYPNEFMPISEKAVIRFQNASSRLIWAAYGLLFATVIKVAGFLLFGAGHGTMFFVSLGSEPAQWNGGWLFWPVVGFVLYDLKPFSCRLILTVLVGLHYLRVISELFSPEGYYVWRSFVDIPLVTVPVSAIYVSGQIFLWKRFLRSRIVNDQAKYASGAADRMNK